MPEKIPENFQDIPKETPKNDNTEHNGERLDAHLDRNHLREMLAELADIRRSGLAYSAKTMDPEIQALRGKHSFYLYTKINRSKDSDWLNKPGYYSALYEELQRRGLH